MLKKMISFVAVAGLVLALAGTAQVANAGVISVFNADGTFTPTEDGIIQLLVVGGGGAGWSDIGAAGGGGGVSYGTYAVTFGTTYTVTVGAGGAAAYPSPGNSGGTSSFIGGALSLSATGGISPGTDGLPSGRHGPGGASGSGVRDGVAAPGFAGGLGKLDNEGPNYFGGGGGGATAEGIKAYNQSLPWITPDGGAGILAADIFGGVFVGSIADEFAGGGGGGGTAPAPVGLGVYGGGDGHGEDGGGHPGENGIANTGGGGGGAANSSWGGDGGSGFVVLSFVPEPATMALLGLGSLGVLLRRRRRS